MLNWLFRRRVRLNVDAAGLSEQGLVRRDNQDNFFVDRRRSLFVVADGMGGAEGGAKASEIACTRLASAAEGARTFEDLMRNATDAITAANHEVRAFAAEAGYRQMGTTLAALFIDLSGRYGAVVAHAGDSRIYRIRSGAIERLTHDHTIAGELSRRSSCLGLMEELKGRAGQLSHILTRAIGIEDTVTPDWRRVDIRCGDAFMICSDGVYDMIPDETILAAFTALTAHETAEAIGRSVLAAGAKDNYTCIVVKIKDGGGR